MNNFFPTKNTLRSFRARDKTMNEITYLCHLSYRSFYSPNSHLSTDIPADAILELFGKTFFEFCQDSGYDKILQVLGATPRDFLQVRKSFWF